MLSWFRKLMGGARTSVAPPIPQGLMDEVNLRAVLRRETAPLYFVKPANIDPFQSLFGTVRLAEPSEIWPTCEGVPMWPLCQINLTQAPLRPQGAQDISLITIFIRDAHAGAPTRIIDTTNPSPDATWAVRSYPLLTGLTIPKQPKHGSPLTPQMGHWGDVCDEYADQEQAATLVDTAANIAVAHDWWRALRETKVGGWPATIHHVPQWPQADGDTWDFILQIENEDEAGWSGWGKDGAAYIARSRERPHIWAIEVQVPE